MEIKSLNRLANILQLPREYLMELSSRKEACYRPYMQNRRRKDGSIKTRRIDNPNDELKDIQRRINERILKPLVNHLPDFMHGARNKKSIRTNAQPHVGKEAILSLDLKDCFPNIKPCMVYGFFRNGCKCIPPVARVLTELVTYDNGLPQGAPTSASLCNLLLYPMLKKLNKRCQEEELELSQFIDDIFISGKLGPIKVIRHDASKIISRHHFKNNRSKNKITTQEQTMMVAGVVVNYKLSIGRRKKHRIEREIMKLDFNRYTENRGKDGAMRRVYDYDRVQGKIASVCAVNQEQGCKLQKKFNKKRLVAKYE